MPNASPWHHLYQTASWRRLRKSQLSAEPLCRYCLQAEDVVEATVCDHVVPHKGDLALFHDPTNLQSLCKSCHDSVKQSIEAGRKVVRTGTDGYPIEIS